nr:hypothetical protein [Tanacetum cinerariifolium]
MSWRHHDSSVVDSFPKPEEFNELEVERLREVVITLYKPGPSLLYVVGLSNVWKYARHMQILKDLKRKAIGMLLPPGTARLTHTTLPTTRLEDILPKIGYLEVAEIPFRKLLAEKEKKRAMVMRTVCLSMNVIARMLVGFLGYVLNIAITIAQDNSRNCRDTLANIFTPVDNEWSWGVLCQSTQQHANVLLRFKALSKKHVNLAYAHESCKEMKVRFRECHNNMSKLQLAYDENVSSYDQLMKDYDGHLNTEKGLSDRVEELEGEKKELEEINIQHADQIRQLKKELKKSEEGTYQPKLDREKFVVECGNGEMVRCRIINEYLHTLVYRLHKRAEYKRSLGKVFSLAIGKGFMDGISIGRLEENVQAILTATLNVDPSCADIFMEE